MDNTKISKIHLYIIDDEYIKFLSQHDSKVCDSKIGKRKHTRKYIGAVLVINSIKYFAPLSSPKPKDYEPDGKTIRKDPIFLTRIITKDETGQDELKGRILIANMIPMNDIAAKRYDITAEKDLRYKQLIIKEMEFITKNRLEIYRKAQLIYRQKEAEKNLRNVPKYLPQTINFKTLENVYKKYKLK